MNVLTVGTEYVSDKVFDEIASYNYLVDQHTKDFDFKVIGPFTEFDLLSGVRFDKHNLVDKFIASPRFAFVLQIQIGYTILTELWNWI
jgi:outer membrane receptor for ferrienterochelin and colicins